MVRQRILVPQSGVRIPHPQPSITPKVTRKGQYMFSQLGEMLCKEKRPYGRFLFEYREFAEGGSRMPTQGQLGVYV